MAPGTCAVCGKAANERVSKATFVDGKLQIVGGPWLCREHVEMQLSAVGFGASN